MVLWFTTWQVVVEVWFVFYRQIHVCESKWKKNLLIQVLDDGIHNDIEVCAQLL